MKYFVKTPWWLKRIYSSYVWNIKTRENLLYLSFDDGPHMEATPFVLDELKKRNAKASFFCIGKNVVAHPELYKRILDEGHTTGNHTYEHLNGWHTPDKDYLADVTKASACIDSVFFRPPYGRIRSFQARNITRAMKNPAAKIIMWDVLSGDFDTGLTKDRCLQNVILNTVRGSIIVFHDSAKAFPLLEYALPRTLDLFLSRGFSFAGLKDSTIPGENGKKILSVNG